MDRTDSKGDTKLAQPGSRPVRSEHHSPDWTGRMMQRISDDAFEEFARMIEHNLKNGTRVQRGAARELLLRYLEGRITVTLLDAEAMTRSELIEKEV